MRTLVSWLFCVLVLLTGCATNSIIVNDVDEREANEIIVFLASKNIPATKIPSVSTQVGGGGGPALWSIEVEEGRTTDAMAILNQNGLPRRKGTTLLTLFAGGGLMTTDKEETIRYQAGLAEQIANTIRKIDGVIDADVQLSFPSETTALPVPGAAPAPIQKVTASVYVKHQGIIDDPNSHLVTKIKRLVASAVNGLDINDVTVISDRSRFTDVTLHPMTESIMPRSKEYVSIWSIVMSKESASKFRMVFAVFTILSIVLALVIGWFIWKFYPVLRQKGGFKKFFAIKPIETETKPETKENPPE